MDQIFLRISWWFVRFTSTNRYCSGWNSAKRYGLLLPDKENVKRLLSKKEVVPL